MKKFVMNLLCLFYLISCASSKSFEIKENYETMSFEIIHNNQIKFTLPFSRYCGYQTFDNKCYFIDCVESRAFEYGELCFFDSKTDKIVYTGIMSGSSFLVNKNYIIVSSLVKVEITSDIEDVFGLGLNEKEYPLDISIYDSKEYKKLKSFDLKEYRKKYDSNTLFINIMDSTNEKVNVEYRLYDTTNIIPIGSINLQDLLIE